MSEKTPGITEIKNDVKTSCSDLLLKAIEEEFENVVIFGFKDGEILYRSSKTYSRHQIMGALFEAAMNYCNAD